VRSFLNILYFQKKVISSVVLRENVVKSTCGKCGEELGCLNCVEDQSTVTSLMGTRSSRAEAASGESF
jgi:hypothetical protein